MKNFDPMSVKAILFDKDGTLFDFQKTWAPWAKTLITRLAEGDVVLTQDISHVLGYEFELARFKPDSISVSCTPDEQIELLKPLLPHLSKEELKDKLVVGQADVSPIPITGLTTMLDGLVLKEVRLGVVTNDFEAGARLQLEQAHIQDYFDVVIGFDSGFGGKPAPDGCLAGARMLGCAAEQTVMVGDSLHDLQAGRSAGMPTIGVLTGTATKTDLAPHADVVVSDVSEIEQFFR
jgi:phosphoglycolate phosphatase